MRLLEKISRENDNPFAISKIFLKEIGVLVTDKTLKESLENHKDFPSLLSVKDVLSTLGVRSVAVNTTAHSLSDFETPFVCPIQKKGWHTSSFTLMKKIDHDVVTFYNSMKSCWENVSLKIFTEWSTGVILLSEISEHPGESDYQEKAKTERIENFMNDLPLFLTVSIVLFSIIFESRNSKSLQPLLRTLRYCA